jgi:hypothetical protein
MSDKYEVTLETELARFDARLKKELHKALKKEAGHPIDKNDIEDYRVTVTYEVSLF